MVSVWGLHLGFSKLGVWVHGCQNIEERTFVKGEQQFFILTSFKKEIPHTPYDWWISDFLTPHSFPFLKVFQKSIILGEENLIISQGFRQNYLESNNHLYFIYANKSINDKNFNKISTSSNNTNNFKV